MMRFEHSQARRALAVLFEAGPLFGAVGAGWRDLSRAKRLLALDRVVHRGRGHYLFDSMASGSSQSDEDAWNTGDWRSDAPPVEVRTLAESVASAIREEIGSQTGVLWFGSWVEGDAVSRSDLDLAVDAGRALVPAELARIDLRVDDLPSLRKIDIVDLYTVGAEFRRHILEVGRSL